MKISPDRSKGVRPALRYGLYPWTIVYLIVAVFSLGALPATYVLGTEGFYRILQSIDNDYIFNAYVWTVLSCLLLYFLFAVSGGQKNLKAFVLKTIELKSQDYYRRLWMITFILSMLITGWMFFKTGYRLPIREALGLDFVASMQLRQAYETQLNQSIFNIQLYGLGIFNCAIVMFGLKRRRLWYSMLSAVNIVLICAFSLAKSPIANFLLIMAILYTLVKPIPFTRVILIPVLFISLVWPLYTVSGILENMEQTFISAVAERILYGQWISLPFYFEIFRDISQPYGSVLPPYVQSACMGHGYEWGESPSRMVMREIVGDVAVDQGGAGVATTFFIGEAYALGGAAGIIGAILLVAFEAWLLSFLFLKIKKTIFSTFLLAFMLFKLCIGIISGISVFVLSGFTFVLFALAVWVYLSYISTMPGYESSQ